MNPRATDTLIAEHVFGLKPWRCSYSHETEDWSIYRDRSYEEFKTEAEAIEFKKSIPPKKGQPTWYKPGVLLDPNLKYYSTSIADAWLVVEKMHDTVSSNGDYFCVDISSHKNHYLCVVNEMEDWRVEARAPTAPVAICKAALKALGVEVKE